MAGCPSTVTGHSSFSVPLGSTTYRIPSSSCSPHAPRFRLQLVERRLCLGDLELQGLLRLEQVLHARVNCHRISPQLAPQMMSKDAHDHQVRAQVAPQQLAQPSKLP